ncbi:hypothetical protein D3C85_686860 [compost metagenome]
MTTAIPPCASCVLVLLAFSFVMIQIDKSGRFLAVLMAKNSPEIPEPTIRMSVLGIFLGLRKFKIFMGLCVSRFSYYIYFNPQHLFCDVDKLF